MKLLATSVTSLSLLALVLAPVDQTPAQSGEPVQALEITRNGSQVPTKGPAENFTGSVRIDPLFPAREPSRTSGASVTFEPGARTAWHTHPAGQIAHADGWVGLDPGMGRPSPGDPTR
jgi:hypothetical protein